MAVQGLLVPQDPNDEPASVLLQRIREEKQKLVKEGKIKKDKHSSVIFRGSDNLPYESRDNSTPVCIAEQIPFEIPDSWEWARLGEISDYSGKKIKISPTAISSDTWCLDLEDIEKGGRIHQMRTLEDKKPSGEKTVFSKGQILYSKLRPYLLKILIAPQDGVCTSEIVPFNLWGNLSSEYVVTVLKTPYVDCLVNSTTFGIKMPRVSTETMNDLFIPIPPLSEQRRIVAKLEELLPLVEEYGKAESELTTLNATFPEALKKSILQDAVQGKLVPQDPDDEPASVLLERIRQEKKALDKTKKGKRNPVESRIVRRDNSYYELCDGVERCVDELLPFEIPDSWEWARLGEISTYIQRGKTPKYSKISQYPVISQKCIQWTGFSIDKARFIVPETLKGYAEERFLVENDLLWNSTGLGTLGRIAIYHKKQNPYSKAVADGHVTVIRLSSDFSPLFVFYYIASPTVQKVIEEQSDGTTKQKELALSTVQNYFIPIPPLSEQRRIVAKLEELLKQVEKLK